MTPHPLDRLRRATAGALLGLVALGLVTALLGGALAAYRANDTIDTLAQDLHHANQKIDTLSAVNARLLQQNRRQHHQVDAVVRLLRRNGLPVPPILAPTKPESTAPPGDGVGKSPKAPAASGPSSPHPPLSTGRPTPRPSQTTGPLPGVTLLVGPLDLLCELIPMLCITG
jgi:hypothetical protein